jgi:hypothetical protein
VPCSRRAPSTARLSTARHRLVEAPACSASPQPAGRERARRAHAQSCSSCHCLPISRVLAVDRSTFSWLCCKPRLAEASPRPHLSYLAASHSACEAACSALRVRPAAATHLRIPVTLSASLCAPAAGVIPDLWSPLGSFPELPCSRSCSARSLCLCAAGRWQPLSATPTLWEWVRAGMS